MPRESIRPITIARIIEILALSGRELDVTPESLSVRLGMNNRRAKELLAECGDMGVVTRSEVGYRITPNGRRLLGFFENEDWKRFREYFRHNYPIFKRFLEVLEGTTRKPTGLTIEEMISQGLRVRPPLNQTAIDVLSKLAERLGHVQRNLYSSRFYLINPGSLRDSFASTLLATYDELNVRSGVGLSALYVEIPLLRENVCEKLKIPRDRFDDLFLGLYHENIGTMELSGAPIITRAKRSRYAVRTLQRTIKEDMLAPKLDLEKERRGIELLGKSYYYVAFHGKPKKSEP